MAYRRTGLGAAADTVSQSPDVCQPFTRWSDPLCLIAAFEGEYFQQYEPQVAPMITQAYVQGSTPVRPPEAYDANVPPGGGPNATSADATQQYILSQSQANALALANQAAAAQAKALAPASSVSCIADPSSFACWIEKNSTTLIWIGVAAGLLFAVRLAK